MSLALLHPYLSVLILILISSSIYDDDRYSICIAFTILSILSCIVYGWACWSQNRHRERIGMGDEGLTEGEKTELGDMSPTYRYLL